MPDSWIEKFRKEAVPQLVKAFNPERIILFGSRVKGTAKKESDIDAIIISSSFANTPFLRRMPSVLKKVSFPKHVDYICYFEARKRLQKLETRAIAGEFHDTPAEFRKMKNESAIIKDAMENHENLL